MTVGTRSVLFGVHCFLIHPWFVAAAWWRLFGFPTDLRLWVAFFVHDLGYCGKPNMDGPEGETHVELGARIMHRLFDRGTVTGHWECARHSDGGWVCRWSIPVERGGEAYWFARGQSMPGDEGRAKKIKLAEDWNERQQRLNWVDPPWQVEARSTQWRDFTLYHSRFYAKRALQPISRLCIADKYALVLTPPWLFLLLARASGELYEYIGISATAKGKYAGMHIHSDDAREWIGNVQRFLRDWVTEQTAPEPGQ